MVAVVTSTACCSKGGSAWFDAGVSSSPSASAPTVAATPPVPTTPHAGDVPPSASSVVLPNGSAGPLSFSSLVRACDPAVVTIRAREEARGRTGRRQVVSEGLGTGFLYQPNGYILTNNHVVAEATQLIVKLADERRLEAKLVGRDPATDVAILKIDVTNAPHLPLGDSTGLDVGDWVVAIGNPFGLSHTVSAGIISAKGRTRADVSDLDVTRRGYFNFLQTDAAINQGNSGGPLINLRGEVIGINTAIRANANNIGFAIPINMVKSLVPMLVRDGKVTRSALGISVGDVLEADMDRLKRPNRKGALVRGVQPGGGADKAGLAADDVIIAFDGVPVGDPEELRWQASIAGVGKVATVRVIRGERQQDFKVTLGALPDEPTAPPTRGGPPDVPGFP
jgi:serine protease Do